MAAGNGADGEVLDDVLTAEEKMQLDSALRMGNSDEEIVDFEYQENTVSVSYENGEVNGVSKERKSWFGWNGGKKGPKNSGGAGEDAEDPRILKKFSKLAPESNDSKPSESENTQKKGKEKGGGKKKKKGGNVVGESNKHESEYKKGLRPVLWLTPDFPLKTDELLPLLDILANKVKAVRRLRELLTTKLPTGTFPVKKKISRLDIYFKAAELTRELPSSLVAIPIVPTIRVVITFTKFEELQPSEEFSTPLSSPAHFQDGKSNKEAAEASSTSWMSWMRGSRSAQSSDSEGGRVWKDEVDPFHIPSDYTWVDANEKKRRLKAKKSKAKKSVSKKSSFKNAEGQPHSDGLDE
ncbi:hypothetical protein QJS10_CPB21g00092 [Acorus calamus]|uniref:Ankyrin repeat domain-containing protein n=1 Tax=Acorus calamus TaxID=4465 RepID=A0AAV9C2V8_ACOCL|nr:hypothetical protein QJS10_CPB21g00092 [Acorus calamus]